ncbi:MAG: AMP-binding protein [Reyranella sp.]|nr:AMP-binding protein [Reyranella sp.]
MPTIPYYDWIAHHAGRRPTGLAIHDLQTSRRFTYAELDARTDRLVATLAAMGIGKGDRVALLAPNCAEYFELQFACGRLGAIMLPLNWRLTVPELEYILGDSSPKLLIHDRSFAEQAKALSSNRLEIDHDAPDSPYERALADAGQAPAPVPLTHDDIGMVMYTSGTTGHPKGAIITHGMVFWNCVNLGIPALITPQTVQLVVLPLFHTGGLNCYANPVLHAGGTILIMRTFDPGLALDYISDPAYGITHFFAVPAPYQFMMQHPKFQGADMGEVLLPAIYPFSFTFEDQSVMLGRQTVFAEDESGYKYPLGQKTLIVDGEEIPFLEVRLIEIDQPEEDGDAPEAPEAEISLNA